MKSGRNVKEKRWCLSEDGCSLRVRVCVLAEALCERAELAHSLVRLEARLADERAHEALVGAQVARQARGRAELGHEVNGCARGAEARRGTNRGRRHEQWLLAVRDPHVVAL